MKKYICPLCKNEVHPPFYIIPKLFTAFDMENPDTPKFRKQVDFQEEDLICIKCAKRLLEKIHLEQEKIKEIM